MSNAQYSADEPRAAHERRGPLLRSLGAIVRERRNELGLTMKRLGEEAGVSERFLAQLEAGEGNISVARLEDVAEALGTTAAGLLSLTAARSAPVPPQEGPPVIALLGLRGAGKSTLGARIAKRLRLPFVELDALVARDAGMSLGTLFEMHGEAYFHRLERATLLRLLDECKERGAVLATGGSIVQDPETFALLKERTRTFWLRARARDHWDRVVAQGDVRPMRDRADAMSELRALLRERKALYAQARWSIDTSRVTVDEAVERVVKAVARGGAGTRGTQVRTRPRREVRT